MRNIFTVFLFPISLVGALFIGFYLGTNSHDCHPTDIARVLDKGLQTIREQIVEDDLQNIKKVVSDWQKQAPPVEK